MITFPFLFLAVFLNTLEDFLFCDRNSLNTFGTIFGMKVPAFVNTGLICTVEILTFIWAAVDLNHF
jgi:hypothetical protein